MGKKQRLNDFAVYYLHIGWSPDDMENCTVIAAASYASGISEEALKQAVRDHAAKLAS